jgi:hypothetical protein
LASEVLTQEFVPQRAVLDHHCSTPPSQKLIVSLPKSSGRSFIHERNLAMQSVAQAASEEQFEDKRKNARMQNYGECLDELDQYPPARIIVGMGFRRSGNKKIGAFHQYLEGSYGSVERSVPVVYLSSGTSTEPPQVTNCVFFVMRRSEDVQRVLQIGTHTLEDGTVIKVRAFIGKGDVPRDKDRNDASLHGSCAAESWGLMLGQTMSL